MTDRELILLRFICDTEDLRGHGPTFDAMRAHLNLKSRSGPHRVVTALKGMGYVETSSQSRSNTVITDAGRRNLEIIENELKRLAEAQGKCPTCGQAIGEKAA